MSVYALDTFYVNATSMVWIITENSGSNFEVAPNLCMPSYNTMETTGFRHSGFRQTMGKVH